MPNQLIIPTAEPFYFPGNRTGVLLVHGFTGTPKEMRWMGEYLAGEGFSVACPRLAGHATRLSDLARTRWTDWLASVEDGLYMLSGSTDRVFIAGLSMGGALALLAAARYPLAGVITMSAPYALQDDWRLNYLSLIQWLQPEVGKGPADWHNPEAAKDHVAYPVYPTAGVAQLAQLLKTMRACLPEVRIPALLFHSHADQGVAPENMERIYAHLGSADKHKHWLENSGHVMTREPERELVFQMATQFIRRVSNQF
ncbi:MAG: alpha/beta fold hydrolase [Chloroflexi bacterium]|nr:alpha/beta fold hydrolase [Anaerolineaceae bacterium]NMB89326.1 alpha/beta fold hydrolase [Chloroflexota bacterium]